MDRAYIVDHNSIVMMHHCIHSEIAGREILGTDTYRDYDASIQAYRHTYAEVDRILYYPQNTGIKDRVMRDIVAPLQATILDKQRQMILRLASGSSG